MTVACPKASLVSARPPLPKSPGRTRAKATLSAAWGRPPADRAIVPYWHEVVATNRDRLHDRDPDLIFPGEVFELPPPPTA